MSLVGLGSSMTYWYRIMTSTHSTMYLYVQRCKDWTNVWKFGNAWLTQGLGAGFYPN